MICVAGSLSNCKTRSLSKPQAWNWSAIAKWSPPFHWLCNHSGTPSEPSVRGPQSRLSFALRLFSSWVTWTVEIVQDQHVVWKQGVGATAWLDDFKGNITYMMITKILYYIPAAKAHVNSISKKSTSSEKSPALLFWLVQEHHQGIHPMVSQLTLKR